MVYSRILIFSFCLCLALANNFHYPNGPTITVTCDKNANQTYQRIGERYYFLGKEKVTWFHAAHLCRQFGGDLALIESAREMEAISTYLKIGHGGNDWFWISGNDLVKTFKYVSLTNGLPLAFTAWSGGQPDNRGVEKCMHLWLKNGAFRMNNWLCNEKAFYLCQRQNYTRCYDGC